VFIRSLSMSNEFKDDDEASIDYYEVLGVQQWSTRTEIYMAFRKLTVMPPNSNCNTNDAVDVEKIELLNRAKKVLTSTGLKEAYDTKRANKMRCSISARSGGKRGCNTTSLNESIKSTSDSSQERLSDSDISSCYTSSESGGKSLEKYQHAASESELTSSRQFFREGYFSDHLDDDFEREASTVEQKDINNSILEEPQPTSNLNQDNLRESSSKKRDLISSPPCAEKASCAEEATELKYTPKSPRGKRKKKKKKKKVSIIKRIFQNLK